jgi:hypothetical protein
MTTPTRWWEPRRTGEPTNDYLDRVLDQLGATDLAAKALAYHFDDFRAPDDVDDGDNTQRLVAGITDWARSSTRQQREQAKAVIEAVMAGEFDGTRDESAAWAASPEGQEIFAEIFDRPGHGSLR